MAKLRPMMAQYLEIKEQNKDNILFFRLGDFYEMFFEDAQIASKELELTLTGKDCGQGKRAPMCGVPYHSCERYISRLVKKGYKVAICEQMEDPSTAKGIVKREVTRVITKGTLIEGSMLDETSNNYLCAIFEQKGTASICFCDTSTGNIQVTQFDKDIYLNLQTELGRYQPSELLFYGDEDILIGLNSLLKDILGCSVEVVHDRDIVLKAFKDRIAEQFKLIKIDEFFYEKELMIYSMGIILKYLSHTQKQGLERIKTPEVYDVDNFMSIDYNTQRNLELTQNNKDKEKKYTLLWVLDQTDTSMGKRLIKSWIEKPLLNCEEIKRRQATVEELMNNIELSDELAECLSKVFDIERIMTRIIYGSANAREVKALSSSLSVLPHIKDALEDARSPELSFIYHTLDTLEDLYKKIEECIVDDPPINIKEGGIIRDGYNEEIDGYRNLVSNSQDVILNIERQERERTGIPKLRIGYNKVFGYYIEVTNSYKESVPEDYIRKQTLSSCERYITQPLKEIETKLLTAKETVMHLEFVLFDDLRFEISSHIDRITDTVNKITKLDVLNSLAKVALKNGYCKPQIDESGELKLKNSRHPVIEKVMKKDEMFVPNDVLLDLDQNRMNIITGPNMAGKSTYMRQVALIAVMAQIGSFVPAKEAKIGIVNKVFTRVGASDDLASGRSTFMVEMVEVASILKNADRNSLIVLDEIGRGTSTFDGMSIAQAVIEYIADKKNIGAKTLFATHYHELTDLEEKYDGIKNYNILVKKKDDDITFLRKIVRGKADDSYGIEVAKLAGVPKIVLARAKVILKDLEDSQISIFSELPVNINEDNSENEDTKKAKIIIEKLKAKDINMFTPIEAMSLLFELIKLAE